GNQEQMRTPRVSGCDDEGLRAILVSIRRLRRRYLFTVGRQLADQRLLMQLDLLRGDELFEREIRRVTSAGRADIACAAANARGAATVGNGVLRLRRRLERNAAAVTPFAQAFETPREWDRLHRIRLAAFVFGKRARLAGDAEPPLGFTIEFLEFGP